MDECLDVAAVDDLSVLGVELAEAGHDMGGQLGQSDLAEHPDSGHLGGAYGTAEGEQQVLGECRERDATVGLRVDAQQCLNGCRACLRGVQQRQDRRGRGAGPRADDRCRVRGAGGGRSDRSGAVSPSRC